MQGSLSLDLVYAEYLVFLIIPEGWIGTLGLGEDVWECYCISTCESISCGPCGRMEVGQKMMFVIDSIRIVSKSRKDLML